MSRRAKAVIDVGAIERNARRLRTCLTAATRLCAVVKADGYGHGATETARAALAGGATWLAVATADEAANLRRELVSEPILVLGPLDGPDLLLAIEADADIVAWTAGFVRRVDALARSKAVRLHLKLDTGMGRLGVRGPSAGYDLAAQIDGLTNVRLVGVMTHFATADELDNTFFTQQLSSFAQFAGELRRRDPRILVHAANSAATLRSPASHFGMVRCGIALYGLDPFQNDPGTWQLEPVLELRSYVARVARIEPGESVGYGRMFSPIVPTYVATVPIGYVDGVRRIVDGTVDVLVSGRRRQMVGAVSMDSLAISLGPTADVCEGEEVVLIGTSGSDRILAEELARIHGTISHEIVCAIGRRVERSYVRRESTTP